MNRNQPVRKHAYGTPAASARICADEAHPCLHGRVDFVPHRQGTLVIAKIQGLPETETNFFAFHIHEGADCCGPGFSNTAGHYNPGKTAHPQHAGDLPPLLSCHGIACMTVVTDRFRIQDVIGKTVVIHSHPDDFKTQPSGDAGTKIACGVICRV